VSGPPPESEQQLRQFAGRVLAYPDPDGRFDGVLLVLADLPGERDLASGPTLHAQADGKDPTGVGF